ncbi:hypothetical protein GCM10010177_74070 [Actinomadura citrea]|nr:hypothetical protein GCM10010177_74070 [Actinomadura citrea]
MSSYEEAFRCRECHINVNVIVHTPWMFTHPPVKSRKENDPAVRVSGQPGRQRAGRREDGVTGAGLGDRNAKAAPPVRSGSVRERDAAAPPFGRPGPIRCWS